MAALARYLVQLEANTAQYSRQLDAANKKLDSFHRQQTKTLDIVKRGFLALGAVVSVRMFAGFIKGQIDAADHTLELAKRLGTSTEALSELRHVASLSGVEFEGLTQTLGFMSKTIGQAVQGNKSAIESFSALGINAKQLAAIPLDRQFEVIADRLFKLTDENKRAALATNVLGRDQSALQLIMEGGADAIKRGREEAQRLGLTLNTETAQAADRANDAITAMKGSLNALALQALPSVAKALEVVATGWNAIFFGQTSPVPFESEILRLEAHLKGLERRLQNMGGAPDQFKKNLVDAIAAANAELAEFRFKQEQILGLGAGGLTPVDPLTAMGLPNLETLEEANRLLDEMAMKQLERALPGIPAVLGEPPDLSAQREAEEELTAFIQQQHNLRVTSAQAAATAETAFTVESQMEQLNFRASVAQSIAGLAIALAGESKIIQLAAIAFERLMNIKRTKMAWDLAAVQAFQSQLIPGFPPSLIAAQAAYAAVKARGAIAVAQAVALEVIGGLAEAAQVTRSTGEPGSFTNPLRTADGSSAASASSATEHRQRVVQFHLNGNFYGWNRQVVSELARELKDLIEDADVVIFGPNSRQALMLTD